MVSGKNSLGPPCCSNFCLAGQRIFWRSVLKFFPGTLCLFGLDLVYLTGKARREILGFFCIQNF